MIPFQTFLFDLDGTIVDHFKAIHRCYAHTLPQVGVPEPTPQQVRDAIGGGLKNALLKFVPPEKIQKTLAIYAEYWERTMLDDVEAMPGALELLAGLHEHGATLAVLTNKVGPSSRLICEKLGFSPLLSAVVGAGDTPWLKPDPRLSAHTLELLGASPASSLLVGDSPFDIDAAHNGGFLCWAVTTGTHSLDELRDARADEVFGNLPEIQRRLGLG